MRDAPVLAGIERPRDRAWWCERAESGMFEWEEEDDGDLPLEEECEDGGRQSDTDRPPLGAAVDGESCSGMGLTPRSMASGDDGEAFCSAAESIVSGVMSTTMWGGTLKT